MPALKLEVISPDAVVYQAEVSMFIVTSTEAQLGIMPRHAPLIAALLPCAARLKFADGHEELLAIAGGFMEVKDNKISLLVPAAETPINIDVNRAQKAYERAKARIARYNHVPAKDEEVVDIDRAEAALKRAVARLKVAKDVSPRR